MWRKFLVFRICICTCLSSLSRKVIEMMSIVLYVCSSCIRACQNSSARFWKEMCMVHTILIHPQLWSPQKKNSIVPEFSSDGISGSVAALNCWLSSWMEPASFGSSGSSSGMHSTTNISFSVSTKGSGEELIIVRSARLPSGWAYLFIKSFHYTNWDRLPTFLFKRALTYDVHKHLEFAQIIWY